MAAAVHGVVRASLDADAVVARQVCEAQALRRSLVEAGYEAVLRTGNVDDPIPALLEVKDRHGPKGGRTSSMSTGARQFLSMPSLASSRHQLELMEWRDRATTMQRA